MMRSSSLLHAAAIIVRRKGTWSGVLSCHRYFLCLPRLGNSTSHAAAVDAPGSVDSARVTLQPAHSVRLISPGTRGLFTIGFAGKYAAASLPAFDATLPGSTTSNTGTMANQGNGAPDEILGVLKQIYGVQKTSDRSSDGSLVPSLKPPLSNSSNAFQDAEFQLLVDEIVAAVNGKKKAATTALLRRLREFKGPLSLTALRQAMNACRGDKRLQGFRVSLEIMDILASRGIETPEAFYITLFGGVCSNRTLEKAVGMLISMAKNAVLDPEARRVSCPMANALLAAAVEQQDMSTFRTVLRIMYEQGLMPNTRTRMETMKMEVIYNDLGKIREKWTEISATQVGDARIPLLSALVHSLASVGAVWEARLALEEMKAAIREYEQIASVELEGERRAPRIGLEKEERWSEGVDRIAEERRNGRVSSRWLTDLKTSYDALLRAAAGDADETLVQQLMRERKEQRVHPCTLAEEYNIYLQAGANAGNWDNVDKVIKFMRSSRIPLSRESHAPLINAYCKADNLTAALAVLEETVHNNMKHRRNFDAIVHACARLRSLEHLQILMALVKQGEFTDPLYAVQFTAIGVEVSLGSLSREQAIDRMRSVRNKMMLKKNRQIARSLHAEVWADGQAGQIDALMQSMVWARDKMDCNRWPLLHLLTYNTAIHACCAHGRLGEMRRLMDAMRKDNILIDFATNHTLSEQVTYFDADFASALLILEAVRVSGQSPDLFTFNFLIQVVSHAGDLNAGLSLFSKMENQPIRPDSLTFQTLLFSAARHGRLDVVEQMLERMHQEGLAPDNDVYLAVVSAYAKRGRHDDALRALNVIGSRMLVASKAPTKGFRFTVGHGQFKRVKVPLDMNQGSLRTLIMRDRERKNGPDSRAPNFRV